MPATRVYANDLTFSSPLPTSSMATLTRVREPIEEQPCSNILVDSHIPSPFPVHLLRTAGGLEDSPREVEPEADPFADQGLQLDGDDFEGERKALPALQSAEGAVSVSMRRMTGFPQRSWI